MMVCARLPAIAPSLDASRASGVRSFASMRLASSALLAALAALAAVGCSNESEAVNPLSTKPTLGEATQAVPFTAPPAGVVTQLANNNLDVVSHDGRVFLAFRTAPSHFASPMTEMYVVSSTDQQQWTFETKIALGTDVREPRFLSFGGQLFLYFAVLGTDALAFEPQGAKVTQYQGPGQWTAPVDVFVDEFIPWRAKVMNDTPYVIGYTGGEAIYDMSGDPLAIYFLTTKDGLTLEPVVPDKPVVLEGGGSETDAVFQDDGSLIVIVRNEAGDGTGWGSKICKAEAGALGEWKCEHDPRKFDSPLVFRHEQRIFLIARRQLENDGNYDLGMRDLSPEDQTGKYLIEYSFSPKRCALWEVDPEALSVSFVLDLPSMGDTCFPGLLYAGEKRYTIYNYSSPLSAVEEGEDWDWIVAQGRDTNIYRVDLTFP